jgi:hypothetical protein
LPKPRAGHAQAVDRLHRASSRFAQPWTWILVAALLVALAVGLTYRGQGPHRNGPAMVSSIDLAQLHLGMSTDGAIAALGDPQGKRSEAGRGCWRYRIVEGGFARLCFDGRRLVSTQHTSPG